MCGVPGRRRGNKKSVLRSIYRTPTVILLISLLVCDSTISMFACVCRCLRATSRNDAFQLLCDILCWLANSHEICSDEKHFDGHYIKAKMSDHHKTIKAAAGNFEQIWKYFISFKTITVVHKTGNLFENNMFLCSQ